MPDANLFDLAAKISVDAKGVDATLTATQKKVIELANQFRKTDVAVKNTAKAFSSDLKGALTTLSPTLGAFARGPLIATAAGLVAATGAAVGLATALFALVQHATKVGSEIHDLGQQSGLTAETLSTFKFAAEQSGKTLSDVTEAVSRFSLTVGDAARGSDEAAAKLKRLGIDPQKAINDLDGALAQVIKRIFETEGAVAKTNAAADAFGKRGGKEMIATIQTMNGDLKATQDHVRELGLLLSQDAVDAADELGDQLDLLRAQFEALGVQVGLKFAPQVIEALETIQRTVAETPKVVGFATALIQHMIEERVLQPLRSLEFLLKQLERPYELIIKLGVAGPTWLLAMFAGAVAAGRQGPTVGGDVFGGQTAADFFGRRRGFAGGGAGGGGGRGGGARRDPGLDFLKQLQREFFNLSEHTKLEEIQEQLLEKQYAKTTDEIKKRILIMATEIDLRKKVLDLTRERLATGHLEREEFQKMIDLVREAGAQGVPGFVRPRLFGTRPRAVNPAALDYTFSLGGGSTFTQGGTGAERPRVATAELAALREQMEQVRLQAAFLASDITSSISNALRTGFEQGIKAGLLTFAQGILQIIESAALLALEKRLAAVFENILGGGGGKSIWSTIIGIGASAVAGGISIGGGGAAAGSRGGFSGFAGGFAAGGYIPPGMWGNVHEGEQVFAGKQGATVSPAGNVYITVNAQDARSFMSRDTMAQITRQITRMQQKRALTG